MQIVRTKSGIDENRNEEQDCSEAQDLHILKALEGTFKTPPDESKGFFFIRVSVSHRREYSKKQNLKKPTTQA